MGWGCYTGGCQCTRQLMQHIAANHRAPDRSLRRPTGDSSLGEPAEGRMFRPDYLSFAGTYQCNLTCPHCCVPIEWPDRLEIGIALRFLDDAYASGIRI